ncbi:HD domain-containing protein [Microbacterium sp. M1A1_1b]
MTTHSICPRCGRARHDRVHRCSDTADVRRVVEGTPGAGRALAALRTVGRPLVVGGLVRDALLRAAGHLVPEAPSDVDIELHTGVGLDAVVALLRSTGASVVTAGARFEVLRVVIDDTHLDVAVAPWQPDQDAGFRQAASRRDFTLDAVAWDPAADVLLDAFGGIDDAAAGILRHTSDRFGEDPLRVLRAVQLVARFALTVHPDTIAVARSLSDRFDEVVTDRVWPEIRRLASGDHITLALDVLHRTDWERHFPELAAVRDVPQDPRWHPEGAVHIHLGLAGDAAARACTEDGMTGEDRVVVVLAAILHDVGKAGRGTQLVHQGGTTRIRSIGHERSGAVAARALLGRVGAPRSTTERIALLVREHMVVHSTASGAPSVSAARRLLRRLGGSLAVAEQWARVCDADTRGRGSASTGSPAAAWIDVMRRDVASGRPSRLLTGRDLVDAGLRPGPVFRAVLTDAADAQDDGVFDDEAGARRWLADRLARSDVL